MDLDIEELRNLLFPDGMPESYQDTEEVSNYIVLLASCGIEKLGREGSYLKEEKNAVLGQTRDVVYANYKTFIHSADCSRTIFKEFGNVEGHLEHLQEGLGTLKDRVENFIGISRSLAQSRQTTSLTLSKHTQMLEILELPQLMDTCVRNGYYEDALEILTYVKRIEKKHLNIPVVDGIVSEVKGGTRLMLLQLLMQLRSSLTLPQCLKVVGLLRRLDVFTEAELRLKFLQARDSWFSSLIRSIPKDDAYLHISKVVEVSRVHLFDIITQYRAIFSDEDSRFSLGDSDINEQTIFHGWIIHKVNQFLSLLEKDLARGVGPNLESLMAQCMFFGQSFSRIGADFRNLLNPIFQRAAYSKFEADVRNANFKFDESLSSFSLMESGQVSNTHFLTEAKDKTTPPLTLMEFLPLAYYTNGLVTAFNGLRQCCPLGLLKKVLELLSTSVSKVISALVDLHQLESSGFTASEEKSFSRMTFLLSTALIPHINICLRFLFPLQNICNVSGVPLTTLQKQNIGQLDLTGLAKPLEPFLPKKVGDLQSDTEQDKTDGKVEDSFPTTDNTEAFSEDLGTELTAAHPSATDEVSSIHPADSHTPEKAVCDQSAMTTENNGETEESNLLGTVEDDHKAVIWTLGESDDSGDNQASNNKKLKDQSPNQPVGGPESVAATSSQYANKPEPSSIELAYSDSGTSRHNSESLGLVDVNLD